MPDLLVRLYDLPDRGPAVARVAAQGVTMRRALAPDRKRVLDWVTARFGDGWASECAVAFGRQPITCFIAVEQKQIVGFACHEATTRGFFGPTGVDVSQRGRGVGTALLLACLHDMAARGYAYGIIGAAGPVEFYVNLVGALPIPGSEPGVYARLVEAD